MKFFSRRRIKSQDLFAAISMEISTSFLTSEFKKKLIIFKIENIDDTIDVPNQDHVKHHR
jgi:hypothetical protein